MLDPQAIVAAFDLPGLRHWHDPLQDLLATKLSDGAHGKLSEWRQILSRLPLVAMDDVDLDSATITASCSTEHSRNIRDLLLALAPWRKGPFQIGDLTIDTEWRSDMKWDRIRDQIDALDGRTVLDVGCGNGYYALRMVGAGARAVIGVDPTLLYLAQHAAIRRFMPPLPIHLLPLRLHELPPADGAFDTTFSMGVLYHQRQPWSHLEQLHATLREGGQLVLETLIFPGDAVEAVTPPDRYARMRNVWLLPTLPQLEEWLSDAGFTDIRVADVSRTTISEQRTTEWMPFESLAAALDPDDPSLTVEGWPAPQRAVLLSTPK